MYVYDTEGPEGRGRATEGKEEGQGGEGRKGPAKREKAKPKRRRRGKEGGRGCSVYPRSRKPLTRIFNSPRRHEKKYLAPGLTRVLCDKAI